MQEISCLLCGYRGYSTWGSISRDCPSTKDVLHTSFMKCSNCGLVYANPQADKEELDRFYVTNYYDKVTLSYINRPPYRRFLHKRLKTVRRFKSAGIILDIGCGSGTTLAYFKDHGYSVLGIEPADFEIARDSRGTPVPIIRGFFPHPAIHTREFDIVYCWHVIEHILDPIDFLRKIYHTLSSDGVLIIGTENIGWYILFERLLFRILKRYYMIGTSTEHTFFPAQNTLSLMLRKAGFDIKSYRIYEDDVKGHPLHPKRFFSYNLRNVFHPVNYFRWYIASILYYLCNIIKIGGSKCEIVAVKKQKSE